MRQKGERAYRPPLFRQRGVATEHSQSEIAQWARAPSQKYKAWPTAIASAQHDSQYKGISLEATVLPLFQTSVSQYLDLFGTLSRDINAVADLQLRNYNTYTQLV